MVRTKNRSDIAIPTNEHVDGLRALGAHSRIVQMNLHGPILAAAEQVAVAEAEARLGRPA